MKPPILHSPRPSGRFILYCDTSKTHTGSSLLQVQDGKPRLVGYASKYLPEACMTYSVTELERTGLALNIQLWKHLLLRVEFDCAVDHRVLPYIMKSKKLPATGRIIRLLELLSGYCFNLYCVKGKDTVLCDYLSRIAVDNGDPNEVILISFNAPAQYRLAIDYLAESFMISHFMVATRSSTSPAGIKLPPVHGAQKAVDPALKPESQFNSKQTSLKPTPITPGRKAPSLSVRLTPSQTPISDKNRGSPPSISKATPTSLLNSPVQSQTPTLIRTPISTQHTPSTAHKQTPVRNQLINQTPTSAAQPISRKLIQKSVKLLNIPRSRPMKRFLLTYLHQLSYSLPVKGLTFQLMNTFIFLS